MRHEPDIRPAGLFSRLYAEAVDEHRTRAIAAIRRWRTEHRPGMRHVRRLYAADAIRDLRIWLNHPGVKQ